MPSAISKRQQLRLEQHLARVEQSAPFFRSTQMKAFLRYVVAETIAGRGSQIKQYGIAVDALGAHRDFDADHDPLVRVHAQRLRDKLEEYYSGPGAGDPVRIALPKGSYAPVITFSRRSWWPRLAMGAAALALVLWIGFRSARVTGLPRISSPVQITFEDGDARDPALSPDGEWMAYSSDRDGRRQIWLQERASGKVRRLTFDPRQDISPDFSPDSLSVTYRSLGNGGGVEIVPRDGGPPTRLADGFFGPRYSPDGQSILLQQIGKLYLHRLPGGSGSQQQIAPEMSHIQCGVWMPDGRLLIKARHKGVLDWWIVAAHAPTGRDWPIQRTYALDRLREVGLHTSEEDCPGDMLGEWVTFGSGSSFWLMPLSNGRAGRPVPVHPGPAAVHLRGRSLNGSLQLVGEIETSTRHLWLLPLDQHHPMRAITNDISIQNGSGGTRAEISPDGRYVAFASPKGYRWEVRLVDVVSGTERILHTEYDPMEVVFLDRSASRVYFSSAHGPYTAKSIRENQPAETLCTDCGHLVSATSRGMLLFRQGRALRVHDPAQPRDVRILEGSVGEFTDARLSPDGEWVAAVTMGGREQVGIVIPARRPVSENEWVHITREPYNLCLRWSADGQSIYFLSRRDGDWCIYRQPLHPVTRRPAGPAMTVRHEHGPRPYAWSGAQLSVSETGLVWNLINSTGNIWTWQVQLPR